MEMSKQYSETRLVGALNDVTTLSHKIDSWQSKIDKLRRDLELQIQTSSSSTHHLGARATDVEELKTAISELRSDVKHLRDRATAHAGKSSSASHLGSCVDGAGCKAELADLKAYIDNVAAGIGAAAGSG